MKYRYRDKVKGKVELLPTLPEQRLLIGYRAD
jgi:hypothetical protein